MTADERATPLRRYRPEPAGWWIVQAPAGWPGAPGHWTHLADRSLGSAGDGAVATTAPTAVLDVLYLPPVAPADAARRTALAAHLQAAGVPVLGQCQPHEVGSETEVLDLLATLLAGDLAPLEGLTTGCKSSVWPLIPGLTDDPADWERGLARLAAAGLETVAPMSVALSPAQRRELAGLTDDAGYQALFHGGPPDERAFARVAARHGLGTTPPRLRLAATPRREFCRQVATELAIVADLWLRLGRAEAAGQNLLRAARWLEEADHDLRALAREGNLEVLPWLEEDALQVVRDLVAASPSALRRELEEQYTGAPR